VSLSPGKGTGSGEERPTVKADPLSAQLEVETCTQHVLPEHLKTGNNVDYVVNELEWVKAPLHQAGALKWT
jgi:hypothetical protein